MFSVENRGSCDKRVPGKERVCTLSSSTADSPSSCEVALSALNFYLSLPTVKLGLVLFTNLSMATELTDKTQFCLENSHVTEGFALISAGAVYTLLSSGEQDIPDT